MIKGLNIKGTRNKEGKRYEFSEVFGPHEFNQKIFSQVVKDLIDSAFQGKKCSFFVYGQTGSGKTHTITGSDDEEGVIQLAMRYINNKRQKSPGLKINISSYEVYKEQIFDLLSGSGHKDPLKISQTSSGDFVIEDIQEKLASSLEEMVEVLIQSDQQRHFAQTYLNHLSSRSHTAFTINITHRGKQGSMTFIDLAGCEKINTYTDTNSCKKEFGYHCSPIKAIK